MVQYTVAMMTKVGKKTTVRPRNVLAAYRSSEQNGSHTPHPNQCGCLQGSSQTGCSYCSLRGRLQFALLLHQNAINASLITAAVYNVGATITRFRAACTANTVYGVYTLCTRAHPHARAAYTVLRVVMLIPQ